MPQDNKEKYDDAVLDTSNAPSLVEKAHSQAEVQIQLIPFSDVPNRPANGEVSERNMREGQIVRIGRQVVRDGQPVMRGNRVLGEDDIWYMSKVVSRIHAEMWYKDGQVYIRDIGSSSGTFLNKMRLSPSGKESRPYPIKAGDLLQFGIDYKGKQEDIYKCITVKIGFHDQTWIKNSRSNVNHIKFQSALKSLLNATNTYANNSDTPTSNDSPNMSIENSTDCCICISGIAPYQALFIAPCSHCFHFKCVAPMVSQSPMFQCPLCRQVANLTASVSMDSLVDKDVLQDDKMMDESPTFENQNNESVNELAELMQRDISIGRSRARASSESPGSSNPQNEARGISYSYSPETRTPHGEMSAPDLQARRPSSGSVVRPNKKPSLSQRLSLFLSRGTNAPVTSPVSPNEDPVIRRSYSVDAGPSPGSSARLLPRTENPHWPEPRDSEDEFDSLNATHLTTFPQSE